MSFQTKSLMCLLCTVSRCRAVAADSVDRCRSASNRGNDDVDRSRSI